MLIWMKTEREGARHLFVQLVQPGEGTEDTRRVARRGELDQTHWPLIRHLADRRLVVTGLNEAGDETVEVVHETLDPGLGSLSLLDEGRSFIPHLAGGAPGQSTPVGGNRAGQRRPPPGYYPGSSRRMAAGTARGPKPSRNQLH